jgi:hypothetical protein
MAYSRMDEVGPPRAARRVSGTTLDVDGPGTGWAIASALFLALALIVGGGTRNDLLSDLAIQLAALPVLVLGLRRLDLAALDAARLRLLWLSAAAITLPLLHAIPLPALLWAWAPGRAELAAQAVDLGLPWATWRAWSLDPQASLASARSLLPALAMLVIAIQLPWRVLRILWWIVVGAALLMVPVGLAQLAQGPHSELRYYSPTNVHDAVGLFANRNHYASLLAMATTMVFAFVVAAAHKASRRAGARQVYLTLAWVLVAAMLLAGATLSRSRAGVGLAVLGILALLFWAWRARGEHPGAWRWLAGFFAFAALIAFQAGFLAFEDRLTQFSDNRFVTAPVFLDLAAHFGWLGTGAGTFPAAYAAHEPLEVIGSRFLNHAHNDWAELWVEFGILLLPVAAAFLWWLARGLAGLWRQGGKAHPVQYAAGVVIVLLLLHSLVDYPLRTTAMSVVFALACATLAARPEDLRRR